MGWGAVAALCPQKTLELGAERNRASFAEYLERELEALTHAFAAGAGSHARLCGGGVAAEAEGPSLAVEGRDYVAAFSGCVWLPCSGRVHSACLLGVVRLAALTWLHKVVQACCPTTCHLPWRPPCAACSRQQHSRLQVLGMPRQGPCALPLSAGTLASVPAGTLLSSSACAEQRAAAPRLTGLPQPAPQPMNSCAGQRALSPSRARALP